MDDPSVTVNGQRRPLTGTRAHASALDWLRDTGLTGAKEGCAEGECGACAVLVAQPDGAGGTEWTSVNACLIPAAALDGQEVVTAEGLGTPAALHEVQQKLAGGGGSQCGYCTPGFVCSMAAEFYRRDRRARDGFDLEALSGNLCRCTGYRPIRDAALDLGAPGPGDGLAARRDRPPPPPAGTDLAAADGRFVRPRTLAEAIGLLDANPAAVLVAGCTDWGVEVNLRGRRSPLVVAVDAVPELRTLSIGERFIEIGAAVPLSELERSLNGRVSLLAEMIPQFASRLIRNRASLGGNLGTGSPIGDASPALLALEARIVLVSSGGEREVELGEYFTGYRTSVRREGEIIRSIRIPLPLAGITGFHKIAKRRFDDISSVAVAFAIDAPNGVVRRARIGLGGVAATPVRARAAERLLEGRPWLPETVRMAAVALAGEGTPMDDHRASAGYRSAMLEQAMLKLHAETTGELRAATS